MVSPLSRRRRPVGIIETQTLLSIPDDAVLLTGCRYWAADDEKALETWFRDNLSWLRTSPNGIAEEKASNNHGTGTTLR
jgi:hypothetical protein